MRFFRRRNPDPSIQSYLDASNRRIDKKRALQSSTIVVLDAEATGLRVNADRILSLATLEIENSEIDVSSARSWLVRRGDAPLNEAVHIHGILPSDSEAGVEESQVLRELLPILEGRIIVGHHIRFDLMLLNDAARRHLGIRLKNQCVDTAFLAMQELVAFHKTGYGNQPLPTLEEVCSQLDVTMIDRHTAIGDTFTTAEVFLLLVARMRKRFGRLVRYGDLPLARL